jgi:hypothetical protein
LVIQPIVTYNIVKQHFTWSKYGKIIHVKETCHNRKREKLVVFVISTKIIELVVGVIAQLFKPSRVPLKYPCITCSIFEHHALNCPRKTKVQNMFRTKPNNIAIVTMKFFKPDNVLVNVVVVMTCNQIPKQHVLKKHELMKAKQQLINKLKNICVILLFTLFKNHKGMI